MCGLRRISQAAYAVWNASLARTSARWLKDPKRLGGVETQKNGKCVKTFHVKCIQIHITKLQM
jgi:hypothetical protein